MQAGRTTGRPELLKADTGHLYPLGMSRAGELYYFSGGARDNTYVAQLDGFAISGSPALLSETYVNATSSAAWSPDGKSVAYYSYRGMRDGPGTTLVIRNQADGKERDVPLTVNIARSATPALRWFPDSRSVLVVGRTEDGLGLTYVRVDLTTGREQELHRTPGRGPGTAGAALSSDGRSMFYLEDEGGPDRMRNLKRMNLETKEIQVLVKGWINSIAVSPDGSRLAYLGNTEASSSRMNELAIIPASGGQPIKVFTGPWFDTSRFNTLSWAPDGKHLLFVRPEEDGAVQSLWAIPIEGGEPRRTGLSVRGRIKHPQLQPNGRHLVYSTREFDDAAVWTLSNFLPPIK
jgi:Tol biopolymer transport system component